MQYYVDSWPRENVALEKRLVLYSTEQRESAGLDEMLQQRGYRVYMVEREEDLLDILRYSYPDACLLTGPCPLPLLRRLVAASESSRRTLMVVIWIGVPAREAVRVLDSGADYVVSTVQPDWLAAQLRAFLRRFGSERAAPGTLDLGRLRIDLDRREVTVDGREVALTPTEFAVLRVLAERPGTVLPSGEVMQQVMGVRIAEAEAQDLLKVHVHRLRQKLEPGADRPRFIRTVRGHGYMYAFERRSPERSPLPGDEDV